LIRRQNPGHFPGAAELIDAGILAFHATYPSFRYLVVMAADTWCLKPEYVVSIVRAMQKSNKPLATCSWGLPAKFKETAVGLATDLFVVDVPWAIRFKLFPLRYHEFWSQYHELISYLCPGGNISVERLARARFHDASLVQHRNNVRRKELAETSIHVLTERMPVHVSKNAKGYWIRRFYWPKIGLVTYHQPRPKQRILRRAKGLSGANIQRLLKAKDFTYYNQGKTIRQSYD
jgi:hypothetical protein